VRLPKSIAVLVVFIGSLVGLLLTGYVIGGRAVDELAQLTDALFASTTAAGRDVSGWLQAIGVPRSLQPSSSEIASLARGFANNALGIAHAFVSSLVRFIFQFFIVLLLAAFLVIDSERILGFWTDLFPRKHQRTVRGVTTKIGSVMGMWVLGQLAISTTIGLLAGGATLLLSLPFPFSSA
jgi:predicted PurR-regulated permease PerM